MFNQNNSKEIKQQVTWQAALKASVLVLVKNKVATIKLYEAILTATKKNGAYYVLEPGIALAHAPIGAYNHKVGIALVFLHHQVQFNNENKYAKIIVTFSAIDATSHLQYIEEFGTVFSNDSLKQKLLGARSLQEFLTIYKQKGGGNDN